MESALSLGSAAVSHPVRGRRTATNRIKPGGAIEPGALRTPVSMVEMVPTAHHALGLPTSPKMQGIDLLDPAAVAARNSVCGSEGGAGRRNAAMAAGDLASFADPEESSKVRGGGIRLETVAANPSLRPRRGFIF